MTLDEIRKRATADEAMSDESFNNIKGIIGLEAHEDRLQLLDIITTLEGRCRDLQTDVLRYRHLRDHAGNAIMRKLMALCHHEGWDAAVDEDMQTASETDRQPGKYAAHHPQCEWRKFEGQAICNCADLALETFGEHGWTCASAKHLDMVTGNKGTMCRVCGEPHYSVETAVEQQNQAARGEPSEDWG